MRTTFTRVYELRVYVERATFYRHLLRRDAPRVEDVGDAACLL